MAREASKHVFNAHTRTSYCCNRKGKPLDRSVQAWRSNVGAHSEHEVFRGRTWPVAARGARGACDGARGGARGGPGYWQGVGRGSGGSP